MNWLSFIASLVSSVAWPATLFFVLFMFRKSIVELIPGIRRLKFKDFEAEFELGLEEVKKISSEYIEIKSLPESKLSEKLDELLSVAADTPNAAVIEAFREVEFAARQCLEKSATKTDMAGATPYHMIQKTLEKQGVLDGKGISVFNFLRTLRNKVAHAGGYEVSPAQATEYVEIAWALINTLQKTAKGKI